MARTARKPGPPTVVFGVYGQGEASIESMTALLDDYIEGLGGEGEITPKFVIPISKAETTATIQDLVTYIEEAGYTYEGLFVDPFGRIKVLKEIGEGATKTTKVDDIGDALADRLGKATEARLLFLWADDADGNPLEEDQEVLFKSMDEGVVALDLTGGLEEIPNEEPSESAEDEDAEVDTGEDEAAESEYDGPGFEEVDSWPVRKVRSFALDEEMHGTRVLTSDQTSDMTKDEILAHFFPEEFDGGEEEPAPAPKKAARSTPSTSAAGPARDSKTRARQVREDKEEETEEEVTRPAARKAAAAAKKTAAAPATGAARVRAQKAEDAEEAEKVFDRLEKGRTGNDEAQADPFLATIEMYGDLLADIIIDRIAERVKAEPEDSAVRKEIAPTRPPGRPRADGKAPVRSRR